MAGATFGKYELITLLGRGRITDAYLARCEGTDGYRKWQVVKKVHRALTVDRRLVDHFLREGAVAKALCHANIVETYDAEALGADAYVATQYQHGQSLAQILSRARLQGGIPLRLGLVIVTSALAGLDYAHARANEDGSRGVIHREVSPHNIFITYEGDVRLLDFGMANIANGFHSPAATGIGKRRSTYLAPELSGGAPVDHRVDIFATGAILSEFMAHGGPTSSVHPAIQQIAERATAHHASDRFESTKHMHNALEAFLMTTGVRPSRLDISNYVRTLFANEPDKRIARSG